MLHHPQYMLFFHESTIIPYQLVYHTGLESRGLKNIKLSEKKKHNNIKLRDE